MKKIKSTCQAACMTAGHATCYVLPLALFSIELILLRIYGGNFNTVEEVLAGITIFVTLALGLKSRTDWFFAIGNTIGKFYFRLIC